MPFLGSASVSRSFRAGTARFRFRLKRMLRVLDRSGAHAVSEVGQKALRYRRAPRSIWCVEQRDPVGCRSSLGIRIRAGGVVDEDGGFSRRRTRPACQTEHLAHRHKKVATRPLDVHLARVRHRFDCRFINARCLGNNFGLAFMALLSRTDRRGAKDQPFNASLRRHIRIRF